MINAVHPFHLVVIAITGLITLIQHYARQEKANS